jgi:hypothetical protein
MFEAMVKRELARLLATAPGCSRNTRIDYALAALHMTYDEAYALAVKRVAERCGRNSVVPPQRPMGGGLKE